MYCPVDGMEYREGITRCPQHDVPLVDEPPEEDEPEPLLGRWRVDGMAGPASIAVALSGIVYAVAGTINALWAAMAELPDGASGGTITIARFAQSGSWAVGLGAFGCLAAAVLAKAYARLTGPRLPADEEDDEELPAESGDWFVPLVSTLTVCFAVVWGAVAIVIAWKTKTLDDSVLFGSPDDGLTDWFAYQGAAAACTLGSLAVVGSLLMARAYDRLAWGH